MAKNPKISLREITSEIESEIIALTPTENQKRFVASNATSLTEARLRPDYAWCRAIYADNTPIGFVMVGYNPSENFCFLWRFMIDAKYQNKGYGKKALNLVIAQIKSKSNIKTIITSYRDGDGNPGNFYRESGFISVGKIEQFGALGEKIKKVGEIPLEFKIKHKFDEITIPNP